MPMFDQPVPVTGGQMGAPLWTRPPLQAEGNLRYVEFIRLVQHLWNEGHPDIPIKPVQSNTFTHYPVITYGLQHRTPIHNEPKPRFRDNPVDADGQMYYVSGQRFENVVVFTVITQNNPELSEQIIEIFEDFMREYTRVFKRLGVSEFMYVRRLPDSEANRSNTDTETRAVSYLMIEEVLTQMPVNRFEEIVINARVFLREKAPEFSVGDGEDFLTVPNHKFHSGEGVIIYGPEDISHTLPIGLHHGWSYIVGEKTKDTLELLDLDGNPINIMSSGNGRIVHNRYYKMKVNLEDLYGGATPGTG